MLFFFKQKTAYEMRISDWSSDVCSSDLTRGGDGGDPWSAGERADQDQEFADEVTGARQAEGRGCEEQADGRQVGDARPDAAHFTHVPSVQTLVQLATEDKQCRSRKAVSQHLDHSALQGKLAPGVYPDQHEPHVRNAREPQPALGVDQGKRPAS